MANTKNKHSFLKGTLIVLGTCVGLGGIATGAYYIGQALGYDTSISVSSYFDELNIATTQIATYTGAAIEPTLDLTEDFTYTIRSIKDSEENEVESAVEIGTYTFVVRIVYTGGSINSYRDYEIELTIQTGVSLNVQENQNSTLLKISKQLLTSGTDDSGYEYQEVSYEVNGTLSASAVEGSLSWAETTVKTMSEYMTFSIDTSAQTVRLTCLQAFDTQIVFTLTSTELNTATASLTIDYEEKLLTDSDISITGGIYAYSSDISLKTIGPEALVLYITHPVYSIGTIEYTNKPSMSLNTTISYNSATNILSYVLSYLTIKEGSSYVYKTTAYSDSSLLLADMKTNVENYFFNYQFIEGNNDFIGGLMDELIYYTDSLTTYNCVELFETYYNSRSNSWYVDGIRGAYNFVVSAYDKSVSIHFFQLDFGLDYGEIELKNSSIVF